MLIYLKCLNLRRKYNTRVGCKCAFAYWHSIVHILPCRCNVYHIQKRSQRGDLRVRHLEILADFFFFFICIRATYLWRETVWMKYMHRLQYKYLISKPAEQRKCAYEQSLYVEGWQQHATTNYTSVDVGLTLLTAAEPFLLLVPLHSVWTISKCALTIDRAIFM